MNYLAALLIITLSLSACLKDETISGQANATDVWVLQRLNGQTVTSGITLTFPGKGRIAGKADCNNYHATQTAPLPWFEPGPILATRMACDALDLETRYFDVLAKMTLIELKGETLLLSNDSLSLTFGK
ncbi:MAG: META domain-containing protein [Rhodobacteraceae bacterium]|nr:META domain-containing protein [Paracoccaceae bacterium]